MHDLRDQEQSLRGLRTACEQGGSLVLARLDEVHDLVKLLSEGDRALLSLILKGVPQRPATPLTHVVLDSSGAVAKTDH